MTVVAGFLGADGVLLGADCRVTVKLPRGEFVSDCAQKIIKLGPSSAIGYSGDVSTVAELLANIWPERGRRRLDPASLRQWLPRVLRFVYRRLGEVGFPVGRVTFLVAGSVAGKPTRIPKPRVWEFLFNQQVRHGFNGYLAIRIGPNFNQRGPYYDVRDSCRGMLFQLDSPEFVAREFEPLSFAVIGSGERVRADLEAYELLLATAHPNHTAMWFMDAMTGFFAQNRCSECRRLDSWRRASRRTCGVSRLRV